MKLYTRRYLSLFIIIAFTAMPGWMATQNLATANNATQHVNHLHKNVGGFFMSWPGLCQVLIF
jgi:hypothetical protein